MHTPGELIVNLLLGGKTHFTLKKHTNFIITAYAVMCHMLVDNECENISLYLYENEVAMVINGFRLENTILMSLERNTITLKQKM